MKISHCLFLLTVIILFSCKKTPQDTAVNYTKWDLIPGNYKVYDTSGIFLYDTKITHTTKPDIQGGYYNFFNFSPFGEYGHTAIYQDPDAQTNNFTIGNNINGIYDSHNNRWVLNDVGSRAYEILYNDTLEFNFEKHNSPYWELDDTTYHHELIKQIAVKQH